MTTRTLKIILAGVLGAFALYIYFYPPNSQSVEPPVIVDENNDTIKVETDTSLICMDFNKYKPSTLTTGLVTDLTDNYRQNQLIEINKKMPVSDPDANSIWFDLDTIKKFIYHIEKNVKKNSTGSEELGLRLYYAAYPNQTEFSKVGNEDLKDLNKDATTRKYGLKHTIVMIPTIKRSSGDVDFNPLDKDTFDGYISMKKNVEVENDTVLKAKYQLANYKPMALTPTARVVARNHGSLIPPATTIVEGF